MQFLFVIVSALAAVNVAFASPHRYQHMARHHAIAARAPVPVIEQRAAPLRKRQSAGKKCRTRSSSAPAPSAPPTSSSASAPAVVTPPPVAPAAVQAAPPVTSSPPADVPAAAAPVTPAAQAAPVVPANSDIGGFMSGKNVGDGTYYDAGLGACGITNNDGQMFAAIAHEAFDTIPGVTGNPNNNPICGRMVTATYKGNTVTVPITDRCGGCDKKGSLDFSKPAFAQLTGGNFGLGRIEIEWTWA